MVVKQPNRSDRDNDVEYSRVVSTFFLLLDSALTGHLNASASLEVLSNGLDDSIHSDGIDSQIF